jgi:predicted transcriptional regulator
MCVNPDGTLSPNAVMILRVCREAAAIDDMARETGIRPFSIKSSIRELTGAGLLAQDGDRYCLTPEGEVVLERKPG